MSFVEAIARGNKQEWLMGVATHLKALVEPNRQLIINLLMCSDGELTTTQVHELLCGRGVDLGLSAVIHHLGELYAARLVTRRAKGTYAYWSVNEEGWPVDTHVFMAELAELAKRTAKRRATKAAKK